MNQMNPKGLLLSEVIVEIFHLHRLLLASGDDMTEPSRLSSARWHVLVMVQRGPMPVANIARHMGLSRQGVQRTADTLAAEGLITYRENPHHRRAKLVVLTPRGREAVDAINQRYAEWTNQFSEGHSPEALQTSLALLRQIHRDLAPNSLTCEEETLDETEPS